MNWRTELKLFFGNTIFECVPELERFGAWNNQSTDPNIENTLPDLSVFYSLGSVGLGLEYNLTHNTNIHDAIPVTVDVRFVFKTFNEDSQDRAYVLAKQVTDAIHGKSHELVRGVFTKANEVEDTNHQGLYMYLLSFNCEVHEITFRSADKAETNANSGSLELNISTDVYSD